MKIGNIVTKLKTVPYYFNLVRDYKDIDNNIPTLLVDWYDCNIQDLFPKQTIGQKKINETTYWCKRDRNEITAPDLARFTSHCIDYCRDEMKLYKFQNLFMMNVEQKQELLKKIKQPSTAYIKYQDDKPRMIYLAYDKEVLGIDLEDIEYLGKQSSVVLNMIKNNPDIKIIKPTYNETVLFEDALFLLPLIHSE